MPAAPPPLPPPPAAPPTRTYTPEQTRNSWRITVYVLLGGAVLFGVVVLWAQANYRGDLRRRTVEAPVTQLNYTATSWRSGRRREYGHNVQYAFVANGQAVGGQRTRWTGFEPTSGYKVCHNPADPGDHGLYAATVVCGQP